MAEEERKAAMPHKNHENENNAVVISLLAKFGLPAIAANFIYAVVASASSGSLVCVPLAANFFGLLIPQAPDALSKLY